MASILGYRETAKAIRDHVDEEDKGVSILDTPGGTQNMTIINESGLYSLILSSKLPDENNEPWFVGKDVASILGYAEPRSAVSKKVDDEDRGVAKMETPSGTQNMTIINESGLLKRSVFFLFGCKKTSETIQFKIHNYHPEPLNS